MKSMGFGALFVGILALTVSIDAAALSSNNGTQGYVNIGDAFKQFYLAFQQIMPCGYTPWNLPPLAPFTLDEYTFDIESDSYGINGSFANIVVTGLNSFRALESNFDNETNVLSYDLLLSEVQILAEGKFDAWVNVAGFPLRSSFNGVINMKFVDARGVGKYTLAPTTNGAQFSDIHANIYFGDIIFNNWNKNYDIATNNFFNKWARESTLLLVQESQHGIVELYRSLMHKVNNQVANISVPEITNWLLQQTSLLSAAGQSCTSN